LETPSPAVEYIPANNAAQVCCFSTLLLPLLVHWDHHHIPWKGIIPGVCVGAYNDELMTICICRWRGKTMSTRIICHTRYVSSLLSCGKNYIKLLYPLGCTKELNTAITRRFRDTKQTYADIVKTKRNLVILATKINYSLRGYFPVLLRSLLLVDT
jgi:hypothetical protein